MGRCTLIIGLLMLASCSESKKAGDSPSRNADHSPVLLPAPIPGAESTWTTGAFGGEAAAVFLSAEREPLFSIMCGGVGGIVVHRHLKVVPPPMTQMELTAGRVARALDAEIEGANPTISRAVLSHRDSFTTNFSKMNAPVTVTGAGAPILVLPPNPMVGEFIRDCPR